jgi:catechol 2,3-dioxygenase-like lactoylglutathione lyase family enzyme
MATKFQITIDCSDPDKLVRFWVEALGYVIEGPPKGFDSWTAYWRSQGLPDEENYDGHDSIVDPSGGGPRIWFQQVDEPKITWNRLHFDIGASGGREVPFATRKERVDRTAERLVELGATLLEKRHTPKIDHYAAAMLDPEGNEFDIN